MVNRETHLWVEKYRPQSIEDCALPSDLKSLFAGIVKQKNIPNMLLCGRPGSGKTTVAKALCEELGLDYKFVNASKDRNIDTLRTEIENYASSISFNGKKKVVIFDEADYLNPTSTQPALRSFIEKFHKNCVFILTCNYKNKIIDPIHSRLDVIDFSVNKAEKSDVMKQIYRRLIYILTEEGVKFNKKVLAEVVNGNFPDFRKTISTVQRFIRSRGELDEGILVQEKDVNIESLFKLLTEKNFTEVRKWVSQNLDNDINLLYSNIKKGVEVYLKPEQGPLAYVTLHDYQYKAAFVADIELNLIACFAELMSEL